MSEQRVSSGGKRPWRIVFLTALGSLSAIQQAETAIYYWQDSGPGIAQSTPTLPPRKSRGRHDPKTSAVAEKEQAKPQGPLIISISIVGQKLRLYDANGLFAESPVSTGMPGHPTPMGVFSVIQKQRFHRSNIYSGAPMPFMQRITWSGVALHAGVVPGHPASHGCIRMPPAFAVKMWNWTKMGARVIITPGEISPLAFSHPLLATVKTPPQPVAANEPKRDDIAIAQTDEKTVATVTPAAPQERAELRSTIGRADSALPPADESSHTISPQTQTADASGLSASTSMSDASPAGQEMRPVAHPAVSDKHDAPSPAVMTEVFKSEAEPDAATSILISTSNSGAKSAQPDSSQPSDHQPLRDIQSAPKTDPTIAIKRSGQIAVFVSRKDSKLYVRQNFSPLFDLPITIAADERPLGTHIFTAQLDGRDSNALRWSVISLPAPIRRTEQRIENPRGARNRKAASPAAVEQAQPDGPAQALDRLNLPAEVMARIFETISTGGSIIVSDQGIAAGETGEGTDFIVSLR